MLALEMLFHFTKPKPEIKGLTIIDHFYLYSACADDATFFLQETISIKQMVDIFYFFFTFLD